MLDDFSTPRIKEEKIDSLVHLYVDGFYNRRELMKRLARYTGGVAAATTLLTQRGLAQLEPQGCPDSVRVPENAEDITAETIVFPGKGTSLFGYLTKPNPLEKALPAVLVIHENQGLTDHIKDVTRRVARAGFIGLGLDFLSRQGGTESIPSNQRAQAYGRTVTQERLDDMLSAVDYLKSEGFVIPNKIGTVGFCVGGANVFLLAFNSKDIAAAVPFYGTPPNPMPPVDAISARMLLIYAENDRGTNSRIPEFLTGVVALQKTFGMHLYQGTNHAFHNDTGNAYNAAAACDAWAKTIGFFRTHLGG